jgi:hypothetical protein
VVLVGGNGKLGFYALGRNFAGGRLVGLGGVCTPGFDAAAAEHRGQSPKRKTGL